MVRGKGIGRREIVCAARMRRSIIRSQIGDDTSRGYGDRGGRSGVFSGLSKGAILKRKKSRSKTSMWTSILTKNISRGNITWRGMNPTISAMWARGTIHLVETCRWNGRLCPEKAMGH